MNFLFVHQNMPGQYRHIAQWLGQNPQHKVVFLTQRESPPTIPGVDAVVYKPHHVASDKSYGLSRVWEQATGAGFGAAMAAQKLEHDHGFKPDIVIGHVGWGELTFFKEIWPNVPIIGYFEYYYRIDGGIIGFDESEPVGENTAFLMHARNAVPLSNIETVDIGQCPTLWQRDRFPASFHDRMYVCHDGVRTDLLRPDPDVSLHLSRLDRAITRDDEIITYVARNMETTRGFHILMRALPRILRERPEARILLVGGNEVSYGAKSKSPGGLRARMEREVGAEIDWSRVHFLGTVPYQDFCKIIQISRCHIYLTMPFVVSWSLLEAMSMQATIVASDVPPVQEILTHRETGLLVNFHDVEALAEQVVDVLADADNYAHLGRAARQHVRKRYDFVTRCLPEHLKQINALLPDSMQVELP